MRTDAHTEDRPDTFERCFRGETGLTAVGLAIRRRAGCSVQALGTPPYFRPYRTPHLLVVLSVAGHLPALAHDRLVFGVIFPDQPLKVLSPRLFADGRGLTFSLSHSCEPFLGSCLRRSLSVHQLCKLLAISFQNIDFFLSKRFSRTLRNETVGPPSLAYAWGSTLNHVAP